MDKQALLDRLKSLWPAAVTLRPDGGQSALNSIYWPIEERLEADTDEWLQLAAWAFHQALAELAKSNSGRAAVRPADVSMEAFDRWMRMNLADETWSKVRKDYDPNL